MNIARCPFPFKGTPHRSRHQHSWLYSGWYPHPPSFPLTNAASTVARGLTAKAPCGAERWAEGLPLPTSHGFFTRQVNSGSPLSTNAEIKDDFHTKPQHDARGGPAALRGFRKGQRARALTGFGTFHPLGQDGHLDRTSAQGSRHLSREALTPQRKGLSSVFRFKVLHTSEL